MKSLKGLIESITLMKAEEQKAAYASFAMVFLLMAVYFVLRPVRDAMASDWSDTEVSFLWNIQFFLSTGIVLLYCFFISKVRFKYVVPVVYGLFAVSFLLFYVVTTHSTEPTWVEKGFYLWVTAFSLLNLSVFWSFMSETFSKNQGKRLFAFIGAGASAGAIVGPAVPTLFAETLGLSKLMLVAAVGLLAVIPIILYLTRYQHTQHKAAQKQSANHLVMQAQWWSGFRDVVKNPYLLAIALFILLYVFINSFVYFQQKNMLAVFSRSERAQILGGIDWLVNVLTFVFAFAITSRMVQRLGMGFTLASLPLLVVMGFLILAIVPAVVVLLALQTGRRVGNYAVTRPAREMLFTQVTPDERFKAKPVIDVVVYRGGDAVSGSLFAVLSDGIGLGLMGMSFIGAGIAACWAFVGLKLGRMYAFTQTTDEAVQTHQHPSIKPTEAIKP
ncbi:MFS transporter [Marinicella sp. S1101]|uniref:NTP/NDP exchange transporter n=1 Tax=Marinicella marina TaxID=2996016 RepID=UPI002260D0DA|nr:MFS transporter [Marinicella marina]MCX7553651.1 MFS transporter [Marinicella marina]MDJ1140275.1 MFS transporter [Marinicella marina]